MRNAHRSRRLGAARLSRRIGPWAAAALVLIVAAGAVLVPGTMIVALLVNRGPAMLAGSEITTLLARLAELHVGSIAVGAELAKAGIVVGGAFAAPGLGNPLLWGTATAIASVLPVLGSALVWLPGTVVLLFEHRFAAAIVLALIGGVVASNIDNAARLILFRRVSDIHPLITLIGAFGGLQYLGRPGVLLGPLALAYFFELLRAFDAEYLSAIPGSTLELRVPGAPIPPMPQTAPRQTTQSAG
jgi:AI-2E family transporter